jgi:WD40 repeat protein
MNKIFLLILITINLFAIENLKPKKVFKTTGNTQSMYYENNKLYAGTSNGTVEIFDTEKDEKIEMIKLENIKDFMGDLIPAKIYSIDKLDDKILIVSQGQKGYRNIFLYENNKLEKIIGIEKNYIIQKANFVSDDSIIFALLSNQIGLYNFKTKKLIYLTQMSYSSFSHYMMDEDKKTIATTDESGVVRLLDIQSGQIKKEFKALNLDRVYQVDLKKGLVLTAGQDRRAAVYDDFSSYYLQFDFLLYSCALSPNANIGAIAYNEQNDILIFDIATKSYLYNLIGQNATLTQILFINQNELFTSSDSEEINYFILGEKK